MSLKIIQPTPSYPNFKGTKKPIGFMLRLAKALHLYGMTAYELEHIMKKIARSLKFDIQCLSQPTNIIMSFSYEKLEPITYVMRVEPGEVNLEKQLLVDDVVARCLQGILNLESGGAELERIIEQPSRFSSFLSLLAFALLSGAIARILGGNLFEILMSLLTGGLTGILAIWVLTKGSAKLLFPTIASLVSALIAVLSSSLVEVSSPYIIMVSGIIVLVPGLPLTTAVSELAHQHMVSGTARLFSAATTFMQIGFGVAVGDAIGTYLAPHHSTVISPHLPNWTQWPAVLLAGVALFVLFQSRNKDFIWVLLAGLVAYFSTQQTTLMFGAIMGGFFGSFFTGLASNIFAKVTGISRSVMLMPGIILLVPGSIGFQSLSLLVEHDVVQGLDTAFKMGFVSIALVTGLLLASLLMPQNED